MHFIYKFRYEAHLQVRKSICAMAEVRAAFLVLKEPVSGALDVASWQRGRSSHVICVRKHVHVHLRDSQIQNI